MQYGVIVPDGIATEGFDASGQLRASRRNYGPN